MVEDGHRTYSVVFKPFQGALVLDHFGTSWDLGFLCPSTVGTSVRSMASRQFVSFKKLASLARCEAVDNCSWLDSARTIPRLLYTPFAAQADCLCDERLLWFARAQSSRPGTSARLLRRSSA